MKQVKVALCVIAKDREKQILRMLESTQGVFDGYFLQDTGSTDKTVEVWEKWCQEHDKEYKTSKRFVGKDYKSVLVNGIELLGDFASARNDSFALAKGYDYAFWMDSDDVLVNAQLIPEVAQRMNREGIAVGLMTYVYAKSNDGLKPVVQKRERLIDLNIEGKWMDRVHETYDIVPPHKIVDIPYVTLEHERTAFESVATGRRNNLIMTQQLLEDGLDKFSDKMLHNLAFDHWEHHEFKKALKYYKLLVKRLVKSGTNNEQLYNTYLKMGYAYMAMHKAYRALPLLLKASGIHPNLAEPYITIAQSYVMLNRWDEAAIYAQKVLDLGIPNTPSPINEYEFLITPRKILEQYYLFKGMNADAVRIANDIVKISPLPSHKHDRQNILNEVLKQDAMRGVAQLAKYIVNTNDKDMFDRLQTAIPLTLKGEEYVQHVIKEMKDNNQRKCVKTILKGKKSIVIFVGGHYEAWNGNTDKEKGIGGSEGMCIQMSRELAALGNDVYVYNECGESDGQKFDGVTYVDWKKFQPNMACDVLIIMRRPDMFKNVFRATKQYLWLHDTEYGNDLEPELFYAPNKVFVLTEAHKQVIKENHGVADDSAFWVTRNGINKFAMDYADKHAIKRDPNKFIYASSYDRGLDNVLSMWMAIKEKHPNATLDIYYGWNTYDAMMNQRQGTPAGEYMKQYKAKIVGILTKLAPFGVREVGRVSQNELYKAFKEASIWLYPTSFYEISCINAMTAQAMGCIPVCTPFAALNETVNGDFGIKAELDEVAEACNYLLDNPDEMERRREPMMKWARKAFDMKSLAKEWNEFMDLD